MDWIVKPSTNVGFTPGSECTGEGCPDVAMFVCGPSFSGTCDLWIADCGGSGTVVKGNLTGCLGTVLCQEHTCLDFSSSNYTCAATAFNWGCRYVNCVELTGGCHQTT